WPGPGGSSPGSASRNDRDRLRLDHLQRATNRTEHRMRGRPIPLSLPRRLVSDLLSFAAKMPILPVQRQMHLGELKKARAARPVRPSWVALFLKAFALTAQEFPELRRVYLKFP